MSEVDDLVRRLEAVREPVVLAAIGTFPRHKNGLLDPQGQLIQAIASKLRRDLPRAAAFRVLWTQLAVLSEKCHALAFRNSLQRILKDLRSTEIETRAVIAELAPPVLVENLDDLFGEVSAHWNWGHSYTDATARFLDGELWTAS